MKNTLESDQVIAPMTAQIEDEKTTNWGYLIGCAVAAGLGSLVLCLSIAKCNRDKKNAFEEMGDTRIYLEGEDLSKYQAQEDQK